MNHLVAQLFWVCLFNTSLQTVLKFASCIYQPLSVQYFFYVSRVYPAAQELRWKQQFYWYKGNTVAVTSFVWRWKGSCYLFYVPFSLLLSPCFHMNCPFMEVFLQRVTAIFHRFYAQNLSWKWEQVLQTVSPVTYKMFQGHMYIRWCRKCFLLK